MSSPLPKNFLIKKLLHLNSLCFLHIKIASDNYPLTRKQANFIQSLSEFCEKSTFALVNGIDSNDLEEKINNFEKQLSKTCREYYSI